VREIVDTFTHGLLGAAAAQAIFGKTLPRSAGVIGFVAGMAPDLDLFFGSGTDPVASILVHRQFTHSLLFIPLGALLVSLLCIWMKPFKGARPAVYGAAFVGYGLHGLLDACTSYGTLLWWPFSYQRVSWDNIAIVDPLFSLILLVGVLWTLIGKRPRAARVAVCCAVMYLGFGIWQSHRAMTVQDELATARGHVIEHRRVMPLPGSLVAWRAVYVAAGRIYVDGVRVPWWKSPLVKPGGSTRLASFDVVPRAMAERDGTRRVFEIFAWFADGLIAPVDGVASIIGDMRYATEASGLTPLWGMQFDAQQVDGPTRWRPPTSSRARIVAGIWRSLIDHYPDYLPVGDVLNTPPR
jgi:inner membrane protein